MALVPHILGEVGPLLGVLYGDELIGPNWLHECQISVSRCGFVAISRLDVVVCMQLPPPGCAGQATTTYDPHAVFNRACRRV